MNTVSLEAANAKQKEIDSLNGLITEFDKLQAKTKLTSDEFAHYLDLNDRIKSETNADSIKRMKDEQAGLREKSGLTNSEFDRYLSLNDQILDKAPQTNRAISEQGNAFAKNTKALKRLTDQKAEDLRIELESQRANLESKRSDDLKEKARLQEKINDLTKTYYDNETKVEEQLKKVKAVEEEISSAKAAGNTEEAAKKEQILGTEKRILSELQDQLGTSGEKLLSKKEELQKINEELAKLDTVKQKMVDLELRQVGLTAKKGEGVKVIDKEIARLKDARANLVNNTSAADKKKQEYRKSLDAIDSEISKLESAKGRVQEITAEAENMNATLSKDITKRITTITTDVSMKTERAVSRGRGNEGTYHTGGIIGRGQINKLHTGGLASKFADRPMSHEVDIRALRNEMVLTEAQQANLMRMIDAGHTAAASGSPAVSAEMLHVLKAIESGVNRDGSIHISIDGQTVANATFPYYDRKMSDEVGMAQLLDGR